MIWTTARFHKEMVKRAIFKAPSGESHPLSQTTSQPILKHRLKHQLMKNP